MGAVRTGLIRMHLSQQYADSLAEIQPAFPGDFSILTSVQINHNQHLSHNTGQNRQLVENNL